MTAGTILSTPRNAFDRDLLETCARAASRRRRCHFRLAVPEEVLRCCGVVLAEMARGD